MMLEAPDLFSNPTEASLHLIRNHQPSILSGQVSQSLKVPLGQRYHSSDTHGRLGPDTCNFMVAGSCYRVLGIPNQRVDCMVGVAPQVRVLQRVDVRELGGGRGPSADIGQRVGITSDAVVGFVEGVDMFAAGVEPGQHVREVVGLTARVTQIGNFEAIAQELAQLLTVFPMVLMEINR